jgi:ribosome maturation factor RimP
MEKPDLLELVGTAVSELKLDDVYPVEVHVSSNRIEVFLDSDEGITFQKCQLISRWLEAIFDADKRYGEQYILEVSSAGVGKPLKLLRQYAKNIGRLIDIRHKGDLRTRGTLAAVEGNMITITFEEKVKEGKKNKIVKRQEVIPFEDIIEAKIKLSF